jgi:hypothetical protein
MADQVVV